MFAAPQLIQTEHFKGVNDLVFASNGDLYFTDQGQTDLNYPAGRVYCLTAAGRLRCVADNVPSPNGLVLNLAEDVLYLAVTRANAVWRLPFTPSGEVARMGVFLQLSGGRGPDRKTLYITDSSTGTILTARVPAAGRVLYSHM